VLCSYPVPKVGEAEALKHPHRGQQERRLSDSEVQTQQLVAWLRAVVLPARLTAVRHTGVVMFTAKAQLCSPEPGCRQGPADLPVPGYGTLVASAESIPLWWAPHSAGHPSTVGTPSLVGTPFWSASLSGEHHSLLGTPLWWASLYVGTPSTVSTSLQ